VAEPHWKVELKGHPRILRKVAERLTKGVMRITQEEDRFFLLSDRFDPEAQAPTIEREAIHCLNSLNGVAVLELGAWEQITHGGLIRVDENGRCNYVLQLQCGSHMLFGDEVTLTVRDKDGNVILAKELPNPIPDWLILSFDNEAVSDVLRWWGTREHDWFWLYKIYELIEEDVAGKKQSAQLARVLCVSREAIQQFQETACDPGKERGGETARHAVPTRSPQFKPMPIGDAQDLIKALIRRWLDHKAKSTPHD
jgi:hypothetical protein